MPPEEAAAEGGAPPSPPENETVMQALARLEAAGEGIESPDDPVEGEEGEGEESEDGGEGGAVAGEKGSKSAGKATQKATAKAGEQPEEKPEEAASDEASEGKPSKAFLEEAEKLGLVIDKRGKVAPRERAQFREWKEKQREAINQEANATVERLNAVKVELKGDFDLARAVRSAWKSRDPEALAKAIAMIDPGIRDYSGVQEEFTKAYADPNYQRLLELEREKEDRKRGEEETKRREAEVARRREEQVAEQKYDAMLMSQMRESPDKVVKALAGLPVVREAIYEVQKAHWDGETTVSPQRALQLGREGAPPLIKELKGLYTALRSAFEEEQAAAEEEAETPPAKPAPKPVAKPAAKVDPPRAKPPGTKTSPTPKPTPSAPVDISKMSQREYDAYFHKRLQEAVPEDEG